MIGKRTILSLAQFFELQDFEFIQVLLEKHDIQYKFDGARLKSLANSLTETEQEKIHSLTGELLRTSGDLRNRVTPRYRYDERFRDFERCLLLDGYKIEGSELVPLDPGIIDNPSLEDDLTEELKQCGLQDAAAIVQKLTDSAAAFRKSEPDLNATLNNARVALQTLATSIAKERQSTFPGNFEEKKWGSVLAYLRSSGFITEDQEKGLAGVFGFVSPGSHVPVGLTELEMTRLGRSFILGMCWFLVKQFKK